jgi:hypothetical protein
VHGEPRQWWHAMQLGAQGLEQFGSLWIEW